MVDAMRAMLDELMGKERNVPLSMRSTKTVRWDDSSVCKYQLCGLCPSRLFKNTKSDLGPCEYEVHDDHLDWPTIKEDFDKADPRDIERYERKLMKYLEDLIREMDRKIVRNKDRADKESAPRELRPEDKERLADLKNRAKEALTKAEHLAEMGEVDQAQQQQQQADAYNKQHDEMFKRLTMPEKTMLVCDICGVFINSTDNEQRRREGLPPQLVMDHLEGKQYLGWKAIRERFAELTAKYGPGGGSAYLPPPPGRGSSADRDRERERDRDRERDRERERERERRERPREYERSGGRREYDRDRDYARERDYRGDYGRDRDYGGRDYRDRDYGGRDYDYRQGYDRRR